MAKATRKLCHRTVDGEIARRLDTYEPAGFDYDEWGSVRPFVLECASRLDHAGWASTTRILWVLARLSIWVVGQGMALDPELVFDPDTVERFVAEGLSGDRSRATYRSVLRRIGPVLTAKAPWEPRPPVIARRQVAHPYTDVELEVLAEDTRRQATPAKRRAARALLALGAGAGLDGRWVSRVTARDIVEDGAALLVRVGEPAARSVPVLTHWEDEVGELARIAGDEFLVGGHSTSRNRTSHLTAGLEVPPGHPRLSASRLRSTWLLWHLTSGTRLPELAAAAGLEGVTVLSDLLALVPAMSESDARAMLRGAPR